METQILLDYSGEFRFETIEALLKIVKENLNSLEIKTGLKKKVVNIMVECLENIYKYTILDSTNDYFNKHFKSKISLHKDRDSFVIVSGNTILNENVSRLKEKIEKVNSLDKQSLMQFYEEKIDDGKISEKGGAGLGIIDIALRSGNKLGYNFTAIDECLSFYELIVTINENKSE